MPRDSMSTGDIIYAFPFSDAKLFNEKRCAENLLVTSKTFFTKLGTYLPLRLRVLVPPPQNPQN